MFWPTQHWGMVRPGGEDHRQVLGGGGWGGKNWLMGEERDMGENGLGGWFRCCTSSVRVTEQLGVGLCLFWSLGRRLNFLERVIFSSQKVLLDPTFIRV